MSLTRESFTSDYANDEKVSSRRTRIAPFVEGLLNVIVGVDPRLSCFVLFSFTFVVFGVWIV